MFPDLTGAAGDTCDLTTLKLCGSGLSCALVSVAGGTPAYQCETPPAGGSCHVGLPNECSANYGVVCSNGSCVAAKCAAP